MEWKEIHLGDIATIKGGKRLPKGVNLVSSPNSHPYIRVRDLGLKKVLELDSSYEYVDDDTQKLISRYIVNTGDIIISIVGTIGLVAIVGKSLNNANLTENCVKLIDINNFDKEFLYYYLISELGKQEIQKGIVGAVQAKLPIKNIQNIIVKAPDILLQQKIASILSSLDAKIENNNKINANLEAQAQALFKSWFVDFEPFQDGEFEDSELGRIPKGWKVGTLESLCSFISRGLSPKYSDETDQWVLGQTCVRNNIVSMKNARLHKLKSPTEKKVKQWDVLINSTGIGSLGRVGIIYFDSSNVAFDSHLTVVRAKDSIYKFYIGRNLLNRQLEIENMAVGSTGQTELPRESVKQMRIVIPSEEILSNFNSLIEPIGLLMFRNLEENEMLAKTRDTLLPKLMSGEIEV